jgi:hypothetical protein
VKPAGSVAAATHMFVKTATAAAKIDFVIVCPVYASG